MTRLEQARKDYDAALRECTRVAILREEAGAEFLSAFKERPPDNDLHAALQGWETQTPKEAADAK